MKNMIIQPESKLLTHHGKCIDIYNLSGEHPGIFFVDWKGHLDHTDPETISDMTRVLSLIKQFNWKVMISGHEAMTGITKQIMDFVKNVFYPEASLHGLLAEVNIEPTGFVSITHHHHVYSEYEIMDHLQEGNLFMGKATDLNAALKTSRMIMHCSIDPRLSA